VPRRDSALEDRRKTGLENTLPATLDLDAGISLAGEITPVQAYLPIALFLWITGPARAEIFVLHWPEEAEIAQVRLDREPCAGSGGGRFKTVQDNFRAKTPPRLETLVPRQAGRSRRL